MTNGIINALAHFGVRIALVRVAVELCCTSGSDGYSELRADKIVDRNKTHGKHPEWTLRAPQVNSVRNSNQSDSV